MKPAQAVQPDNEKQRQLQDFDLREIDALDQRDHFALKYFSRLHTVLDAIQRYVPPGSDVLELGSAQANLSLLLAERGYRSLALDLNPSALAYAHKKHESGTFWTVCANAEAPPVRHHCFDAAVIAELLEHCTEPAELLRVVSRCIKPHGVIIITTPNGERIRARDPTRTDVVSGRFKEHREPGGITHLFEFTTSELANTVHRAGLDIVETTRCGNLVHSNRFMAFKKLFAPAHIRTLSRLFCRLPIVGRKTAITLLVVARPA